MQRHCTVRLGVCEVVGFPAVDVASDPVALRVLFQRPFEGHHLAVVFSEAVPDAATQESGVLGKLRRLRLEGVEHLLKGLGAVYLVDSHAVLIVRFVARIGSSVVGKADVGTAPIAGKLNGRALLGQGVDHCPPDIVSARDLRQLVEAVDLPYEHSPAGLPFLA